MSSKHIDDQRIETIIGTLLRVGVMLSAGVVLIGAVIYLARHGHEAASYSTFAGVPDNLKTVSGLVHGVLGMSGQAIIQLGLLLLIATPIARVAFSVVAFAMEGDYLYAGITLIVLAVLLYSLLGYAP
jgi:uncharacterized membrane protein